MLYQKYFKRIVDIISSVLLLILTSPINIIIAFILFFANGGHIFFVQPRPGKNGDIFFILKFKTMNDKTDKSGHLLPDVDRMTSVGNFIRRNSLDELPQFINVLKGDLSLVGPRPLIPEYLPLYSKEQSRRHNVKPGITGWAQVNGRNDISWGTKFKLDVWYVDHISFKLDLKILFLTLLSVINRKGINKNGQATTVAFNGNN
jgi:lipopolysaccharide/colanic/teichoic acid biosynthesis glycosyltransferase